VPDFNVRREALYRAYYAVDEDLERLRFLLGVPLMKLCDWLAGRSPPPLPVFLRAVDVIVEEGHEGTQGAKTRATPPRVVASRP
jgi:hypothetical protein